MTRRQRYNSLESLEVVERAQDRESEILVVLEIAIEVKINYPSSYRPRQHYDSRTDARQNTIAKTNGLRNNMMEIDQRRQRETMCDHA